MEIIKSLKAPEIRNFIRKEGGEPVGSTPAELAAYFKKKGENCAMFIKADNACAGEASSLKASWKTFFPVSNQTVSSRAGLRPCAERSMRAMYEKYNDQETPRSFRKSGLLPDRSGKLPDPGSVRLPVHDMAFSAQRV